MVMVGLFEAHDAGGFDAGDEERGNDEDKDGDDEGGDVQEDDEEPRELDRYGGDVVGGGIETHDAEMMLQPRETDADDITPEQAAADEEGGEMEEGATQETV